MISLTYGILKKENNPQQIETHGRLPGGGGEWAKWVKGVRRCTLAVRYVSRGHATPHVVTMVHNTVLNIGKLLRET